MRTSVLAVCIVLIGLAAPGRRVMVSAQTPGCVPMYATISSVGGCGYGGFPPFLLVKSNEYQISWPDGVVDSLQATNYGQCSALYTSCTNSCLGTPTQYECWPQFYTPVLTSGQFSQWTVPQQVDTTSVPCTLCPYYAFQQCAISLAFESVTYTDTHTCTPSGGGGTGGGCSEEAFSQCEDEDGVLSPNCMCRVDTPIILDTDGSGYHLTDVANGVNFDIANNGVDGQVAWTAPGSTNAFLALDRNGNGMIDNGSELFGNVTPQPPSTHPNGFLALAVYDQPANGGNGDGKIDAQDAIYSKLLLWIDSNHDGISQPWELHSLPEMGIADIYLNYQFWWFTDQYGNVFRYRAAVTGAQGFHPGPWAYDVILMQ
jgi:hypothetical protein